MTNEEKAKQIFKGMQIKPPYYQYQFVGAIEYAIEQTEQQIIDKACKIISDKVENYINFYGDNDYSFDKQGFIKRFQQAMKGE